MLNEWQEFLDYTGPVTYKADGKKDTAWLGRFTFEALREFGGLSRSLTVLARGFLFHGPDGRELDGQPRERTDYARRESDGKPCACRQKAVCAARRDCYGRSDVVDCKQYYE